jgi:hypothetical protein
MVSRRMVLPDLTGPFSCSCVRLVDSVYDAKGCSVILRSSLLNVWACSSSCGAPGAAEVVFLAPKGKGNTRDFDCWLFGSWKRDTSTKVIDVGVKLRMVSGGVAIM